MPKHDPRDPAHQVNNLTLPAGVSIFPPAVVKQPAVVVGKFQFEPTVDYTPLPKVVRTFGEAVENLWQGVYGDAAAIQSPTGPIMVLYRQSVRFTVTNEWEVDHKGIVLFPDEDTAVAGILTKHVKQVILP